MDRDETQRTQRAGERGGMPVIVARVVVAALFAGCVALGLHPPGADAASRTDPAGKAAIYECEDGETAVDDDQDGVVDSCAPRTCAAGERPIDTGLDGIVDACLGPETYEPAAVAGQVQPPQRTVVLAAPAVAQAQALAARTDPLPFTGVASLSLALLTLLALAALGSGVSAWLLPSR